MYLVWREQVSSGSTDKMTLNFFQSQSQLQQSQLQLQPEFDQNSQRMVEDENAEAPSAQHPPPNRIIQHHDVLLRIDPEKELKIWKPQFGDDDVLVQEYMELLLKHEFHPKLPTREELTGVTPQPHALKTTEETQVLVINLFTSYLQNMYFISNVGKATQREITLFNPLTKFLIPNHAFLPQCYFDRMKENKKNLVICMQQDAISSVTFTNELFLLKIYDLISSDLEKSNNSNHEQRNYEWLVLCNVSRKNFSSEFNIKDIDWDKKEGRVHGSLSDWRKKNKPPPTTTCSKYAEKLSRAVLEGQVDFRADTAKVQFATFLEQSKHKSSGRGRNRPQSTQNRYKGNSHPLAPPPPSQPTSRQPPPRQPPPQSSQTFSGAPRRPPNKPEGREGVKSYKQLFPGVKEKRKENPLVTANRNAVGLNDSHLGDNMYID